MPVNLWPAKIRTGICLMLFCLTAMLAAATSNPGADRNLERVKSFGCTVMIMPDGSAIVRETITVHAEGTEIKHGIFRRLPMRSLSDTGTPIYPGFQIIQVKVNGEDAPYFIKDSDSGKTIYIGREETLLAPGDYTYIVAYYLEGQVQRQKEYDELDWSVNGVWTLPIDSLTAEFRIAGAAGDDILAVEALIGGAAGGDVQTAVRAGGVVEIAVLRALEPGETLTVRLHWRLTGGNEVYSQIAWEGDESEAVID